MTSSLTASLRALGEYCRKAGTENVLTFHRGVEREGLRVDRQTGRISHKAHPVELGSALTHPSVTTDYSESLLEFITSVHPSVEGVLGELEDIHLFVSRVLDQQEECLWPASMPCYLEGNEDVPIAYYGESNVGTLKRVYRNGLSYRYGRVMQCIAGVHYNFSFDDAFWSFMAEWVEQNGEEHSDLQQLKSENYFSLIRNFRRHSWLLPLLFGASPAMDASFLPEGSNKLKALGDDTLFRDSATSLRMSDLGYQNKAQADLYICYNEVSTYIKTLKGAIQTPYAQYQEIGVKVDGEYRQLNTNLLQIENEYYSDIRPKRVTHSGEHPSSALRDRGVEYVEVRIMDLDPFAPTGMQAETLYFLDTFLLYCMLKGNGRMQPQECETLRLLQQKVVTEGRALEQEFEFPSGKKVLRTAALEDLNEILEVAHFLGERTGNMQYVASVEKQIEKVQGAMSLPSADVLSRVRNQGGYANCMTQMAIGHMDYWLSRPVPEAVLERFSSEARSSIAMQTKIESEDNVSFDEYLEHYLKAD